MTTFLNYTEIYYLHQRLPILVVTAGASDFAAASPPAVDRLRAGGAAVETLHLPDHGIHGNGHGLIYEKNSDEALRPVLAWLDAIAPERSATQ